MSQSAGAGPGSGAGNPYMAQPGINPYMNAVSLGCLSVLHAVLDTHFPFLSSSSLQGGATAMPYGMTPNPYAMGGRTPALGGATPFIGGATPYGMGGAVSVVST